MFRPCVILIPLLLTTAAFAEQPVDADGARFFESKIRPLLVARCYECHSGGAAKDAKLKGELLLDSREGVLKGGKGGIVVIPGKPQQSRLIEAVSYKNDDLQMPPKNRLSASEVADLEKWVAMGAPDPRAGGAAVATRVIDPEAGKQFWSFQPLRHVDIPAVKDETWGRTSIDRFILAAQNQKGLHPNSLASREKLIRRAYFDLIGLPPTPVEVAAFVDDRGPNAYEKLIDHLLASPHYGQRWARHWLDVARFGESDGFEHDSMRPAAYQFRDFVIRALNADMPFDRFAQLQIAGDEIAPDDWQAMAATGFLTAGVFPTQITDKEFESTRYNQLDDMVSTAGSAFLGLTIGCARCHDHKFDPIAATDYYRFAAIFATAIRSDIELDLTTPADREQLKSKWNEQVAGLHSRLAALEAGAGEKKLREQIAKARETPAALEGEWSLLNISDFKTAHDTKLVRQSDGSFLLTGPAAVKDVYTLTARTEASQITALRLEALADKRLPKNGPGASTNGNFVLSEIEVLAGPTDLSSPATKVKIRSGIATHQQNTRNFAVAGAFDENAATGWAVDKGGIGKSQAAIFTFEKPAGFAGGTLLTVKLHFEYDNSRNLIGRPRLCITEQVGAKSLSGHEGPGPALAKILARLIEEEPVSIEERGRARAWVAMSMPDYRKIKDELTALEISGPPKQITKVQVTSEGLPPVKNFADGRGYPHFYNTVYSLRRGDPNNKIEPVTFSFPRVLMRGENESHWSAAPPAGSRTSYRRTSLAHWLTDAEKGAGNLLARVIVNRLWQHHFGRGIVATPNDFGAQGDRPTHPELLDWLAADLAGNGWQLKRLHKLMMTSSVYMQDALSTPALAAIDPHDVYMWRWQPRRLEAEPIRDAMLAVGGLLDETPFGPGTLDQTMRRRSVYFTVKRAQLIPIMMVLDWPEPLGSIGVRPTTTVAPQALLFMNSSQARAYAEAFAKRIVSQSQEGSIEQGYRIAFGRAPDQSEINFAKKFIEHQAESYRQSNAADAQASALADFCQALMSANEFIYIE